MKSRHMRGAVLAGAVAGLFAGGRAVAATTAKDAKIRCAGINGCKGQGACAGDKHGCSGMNGCKGQGWVLASDKECKEKHGKVLTGQAM